MLRAPHARVVYFVGLIIISYRHVSKRNWKLINGQKSPKIINIIMKYVAAGFVTHVAAVLKLIYFALFSGLSCD